MKSLWNCSRVGITGLVFCCAGITLAQNQILIESEDGTGPCQATLRGFELFPDNGDMDLVVDSLADCTGGGNGDAPFITSFTVDGGNSTTVIAGTSVVVAWDSTNATSCTADGQLPNWANRGSVATSSAGVNVSTSVTAGDYSLGLQCTGGPLTYSASSLNVTVTGGGSTGDDDCPDSTRTPPPNLDRASTITTDSRNAFSFESIFSNTFPGAGNTENIRVRRGEYAAMRFTTGANWPTAGATGDIDVFPNQPALPNTLSGASAPRMWSISRCEGDFRTWTNDAGCVQGGTGFGNQGTFDFGGSSFLGDPAKCGLEPGTTYYLNLLYTDADPPQSELEHQALDTVCRNPLTGEESEFCGHQVEPARGLPSWE